VPLSLRRGTVTAVLERHEGMARIEVEGAACVAYPLLTGPVALGDEVIVNTQAGDLGLGSGGFDVLYANLTRGLGLSAEPAAHVMKLPYTPGQVAVRHAEEDTPLAEALDGMPVVCCSLHSQLAPACAALAGFRIAYIQLPGGALPVSLSDSVRELREQGLLELTAGVDACFGGEVDCVSVYSALALVRALGLDAAVCGIGPGVVGTATRLGHGGTAAAAAANAALALGGRPIVAARMSEADPRDRHRGLSHHTQAVLDLVLGDVAVGEDGDGWEEACAGLSLSHMGRGPGDDPTFFAAAFAAGRLARMQLSEKPRPGE
jgi:hypothetical protein